MSIELMKELDDKQREKSRYYETLSEKIDQKKFQCIKDVAEDFSRFFSEKDFKLNRNSTWVEATYGNLKAVLQHEDPATDYFGVLFRFDLDLTGLNKSKVIVILNRKEPGISVSSSFSSPNESEENRLKKEIFDVEKDIIQVKNRLDNFDSENWNLYIKQEGQNPGYQFSEPYSSLYDLLTELFK